MNMSIARAGRSTRTLGVAAVVATVALLTSCSGGSDDASSSPSASESATQAPEEVEIFDQTGLLLETARDTLEARHLVVEVADATGQGRPIEDEMQWLVVTQDPTEGTVPEGSTVTITARMTTDPRM
ncbi:MULTISPECIES: PASTA domain-containing protein [Cellulomonas]|jgi:hypothetical protein|uniref:PASTA domain-containing protein n=1 Tax=Cellulomonas TaxID=1707 RepID=UPI001B9CE00C|nr:MULTISPECIES: PASTA domain-containing protein [Cellulomonas]VTR78217.1 hypothetical protein CHMI_02993 [Cellulomonas hominis]